MWKRYQLLSEEKNIQRVEMRQGENGPELHFSNL